jgi:hypothetical protein
MNFMGFDTSNFTEINGKIWVYKNFLSEEECKNEIKKIKNGKINKITHNGVQEIEFDYNFIKNKIVALLDDGVFCGGVAGYDTPINTFWLPHTDLDVPMDKPYNKQWGIVGYLNEFEGGELLFPGYGIIVKPEPGDLIVHHASNYHSVALTKSNQRITYTSEIITIDDNLSNLERQNAIDFLVN